MKKILIVTDDKMIGGVSILLEDILKNISSKFKIDLMILNNNGECFKEIPENINIIYGTKFFNIIGIHLKSMIKKVQITKIMKKLYLIFLMKTNLIKYKIKKERKKLKLKNYDIEIAFKDGFTSCFTGYGNSKTKIQWIHSDYNKVDYLKNYRKQYIKLFKNFNKFIAVSSPVKDSFNNIYGGKNKTLVIPNLIDTNKIIYKSKEGSIKLNNSEINLITVGRLHKDKNIDGLIKIVKRLEEEKIFNNCHLSIIGDGEEMKNLTSLVEELNLKKKITFLGNQTNPFKYLKNADLFILASKHESFGNVIIESLTLGVPVISTKVANIHEMLKPEYGIISENNDDSLYNELKNIIQNKEKINYFKENLNKKYNYNNKIIIKQIEELFN